MILPLTRRKFNLLGMKRGKSEYKSFHSLIRQNYKRKTNESYNKTFSVFFRCFSILQVTSGQMINYEY